MSDLHTSKTPVTIGMLMQALDVVVEANKRHVESNKSLAARVAELERCPLSYDGTHENGKSYTKNTFVTHDGSVWCCNYTTTSRPGDGPAWTLAVKRGKDAK